MRQEAERMKWGRLPTPYSQRPVDFLLRGKWQEEVIVPFPVDESFGASRAPLAARMQHLARHLRCGDLVEVNPRLSLGILADWYGISAREVRRSRDLEEGVEQRLGILDALGQKPRVPGPPHLFLYNTDIALLAQDLPAFDAFLCGFTALLRDLGLAAEPELPPEWGEVARPKKMPVKRTGAEP
jgi:hypothetical protein